MRLMILSLWLLAGTSGVSEKPEIRDLTGHLKSSVFVNANAAKRGPMLEVPRKGRISPCLVLARADLAARAGVAPFQTGCFDCFIKTQLDQICFIKTARIVTSMFVLMGRSAIWDVLRVNGQTAATSGVLIRTQHVLTLSVHRGPEGRNCGVSVCVGGRVSYLGRRSSIYY